MKFRKLNENISIDKNRYYVSDTEWVDNDYDCCDVCGEYYVENNDKDDIMICVTVYVDYSYVSVSRESPTYVPYGEGDALYDEGGYEIENNAKIYAEETDVKFENYSENELKEFFGFSDEDIINLKKLAIIKSCDEVEDDVNNYIYENAEDFYYADAWDND